MEYKNFSKGVLAAELLNTGTSLTITTTETFPTGQFKAVIWDAGETEPQNDSTREILTLEWNSETSEYDIVGREQEDTSAKTWDSGSNIGHIVTAEQFEGYLNQDQTEQQLITGNKLRYNSGVPVAENPRDIPDKTYVDATATALGINYYLRKADHDPAETDPDGGPNYKTLTPDPSEREAEEGYTERTNIADATDYVVQGWMGEGGVPKLVKGTYSVYIQVEKISGRDVRFFGRLFKRDTTDDSEVQIGGDSDLTEIVSVNGVRENDFFSLTLSEDVTIEDHERVVGKIYVRGAGGGSNATVRIYYCGDINSYLAFPTNKAVLDQMYAPNQHNNDNHTVDFEDQANKTAEFQATPDDTKYPTEKLVKDSLDYKLDSTDYTPEDDLFSTTSIASSATPTPTGGSKRNEYYITALAEAAEFAAPSGTPANGNMLLIRITDDGVARDLTWNAIYDGTLADLPTTTTISQTMYLLFIYNSGGSKWELISLGETE